MKTYPFSWSIDTTHPAAYAAANDVPVHGTRFPPSDMHIKGSPTSPPGKYRCAYLFVYDENLPFLFKAPTAYTPMQLPGK